LAECSKNASLGKRPRKPTVNGILKKKPIKVPGEGAVCKKKFPTDEDILIIDRSRNKNVVQGGRK